MDPETDTEKELGVFADIAAAFLLFVSIALRGSGELLNDAIGLDNSVLVTPKLVSE